MISFANTPLTQLSAEQIAEINASLDPAWILEVASKNAPSFDLETMGFRGSLPTQPVKLGSLYWPCDASRFAIGHFVASETQLAGIRAYLGASQGVGSLVINDGRSTVTANMLMLPVRPIYRVNSTTPGLYCITLCDDRFRWWLAGGKVSLTPGTTTWAELYSILGGILGVSIAVDPVASAYQFPAGDFATQYLSIPTLLDACAFSCGQRIVRRLDGTVCAINATSGQAALAANIAVAQRLCGDVFDLYPGNGLDLNRALPASVLVTFPAYDDETGDPVDDYTSENTLSGLALPELSGATGFDGAKVLHCTATASVNAGTGDADNAAALDAIAKQASTDYYRWSASGLDALYSGAVPWVMSGMESLVEFRHGPDVIFTRAQRGPWLDYIDRILIHGEVPEPPTDDVGFWALVGGQDSTTGACEWIEQTPDADGTFTETIDGRAGTTTEDPAYPADMDTYLEVPCYVWLRLGFLDEEADSQEYVFEGRPSWTLIGEAVDDIPEADGDTPGTGTVNLLKLEAGALVPDLDVNDVQWTVEANNVSADQIDAGSKVALTYDPGSKSYIATNAVDDTTIEYNHNVTVNYKNTVVNVYGFWTIIEGDTWIIEGDSSTTFNISAPLLICDYMRWCYADVPPFNLPTISNFDPGFGTWTGSPSPFASEVRRIVYRITSTEAQTTTTDANGGMTTTGDVALLTDMKHRAGDGQVIALLNVGTNNITLANQNSLSAADQQFILPGLTDFTLQPNNGIMLWWDPEGGTTATDANGGGGFISPGWRVLQSCCGISGQPVTTTGQTGNFPLMTGIQCSAQGAVPVFTCFSFVNGLLVNTGMTPCTN